MKKYDYLDISSFVEELMEKKESVEIEFKSAAGGFPRSFWETYSSFANTDGGTIVLGVKEKKGEFYIDSLTDELIEKYKKEFWSGVNNKDIVNLNLLSNDDVVDAEFDGHKVILFYIPRATRDQRPIYHTPNPYNGTYKRNHEGDFKCTEQEVRRMYADANVAVSADSRILDNYTFEDIDKASLEQYRRLFDLAKPGHAWLALDDISLLKKLGGYKVDRQTGKEGFTLAGLLMFGKTDAITDEACAPNFFLDYRELGEDTSSTRWLDRIYPDGTWEANLFQFYKRVLPKLQEILPLPFHLEGDTRKDETPAHVAVREALINTLIHADYSVNASTVITRSKNELVFSNPGCLLVSKQQFYDGGDSVCRNLALQKMFMMFGKAEKAGSGADKIISGWRDSNLNSPNLEEKNRPDKVILTLPLISILDNKIKEELTSIFGKHVLCMEHDKVLTLVIALTEGVVSNERLRYTLNMHKYDITKMLKELCSEGFLVSDGIGRGTTYHLNKDSNLNSSSDNLNSSDSSNLNSSSDNLNSSDGSNLNSSSDNLNSSDGNNIKTTTKRIKKRCSQKELFGIIQNSTETWKSVEEIAFEIGRSTQYLKGEIIPVMVNKGLLEREHAMPNHPAQRYKRKF
ncbi:putative DNA binding domain-containing protein [Bacteroides gallinaceum]|uniref:RNA-binding domain-containing protein n=1 Tax=Bacteroides gallinaceum TaxID=1462571 RepID=UPI0025AA54FB|nr:RNA-binding domain-containing protein [Bacteroides gallinaceum]MDN0080438.1 putative DNA binding domain-containing protein [Bacteroides gallinaceum]